MSSPLLPVKFLGVGLVVAAALGLIGVISGSLTTAAAPEAVSIDPAFAPRTVLVCWSQKDVGSGLSYDLRVVSWNFGRTSTLELKSIPSSPCGGGLGTARSFDEDNLYHIALRACRGGGCSDWIDAGSDELYWFKIPCDLQSSRECFLPVSPDAVSATTH